MFCWEPISGRRHEIRSFCRYAKKELCLSLVFFAAGASNLLFVVIVCVIRRNCRAWSILVVVYVSRCRQPENFMFVGHLIARPRALLASVNKWAPFSLPVFR